MLRSKVSIKRYLTCQIFRLFIYFWTAYWQTPHFRLPWSHSVEQIIRVWLGALSSAAIFSLYYTSLSSLCSDAWYWMVLNENVKGERETFSRSEADAGFHPVPAIIHLGNRGYWEQSQAEREVCWQALYAWWCVGLPLQRAWENVFHSSVLPLLLTASSHITEK